MKHKTCWDPKDIEILIRDYPTLGCNIPGLTDRHSTRAIMCKAQRLNIKRDDRWPDKDIKILKEEYPKYGAQIPRLLKRYSQTAIYGKARSIGLRKKQCVNHRSWPDADLKALKEKYPIYGSNIPELLTKYSRTAICIQACNAGIKKESRNSWTKAEIELLKRFYPEHGDDIPKLLERYTSEAIKSKANRIGLHKNRNANYIWTTDEVKKLDDYCMVGPEIPALLTKYSHQQIRVKAATYGMHRNINLKTKFVYLYEDQANYFYECLLCGYHDIADANEIRQHVESCHNSKEQSLKYQQ